MFISKKCPRCGAKMKLTGTSAWVLYSGYLFPILILISYFIAKYIFNGHILAWIVCGLLYIYLFFYYAYIPRNAHECSNCSYAE
jgi:ribosomal protein S27AE